MGWFRRLRSTIWSGTVDREFEEEARFHLEERIDEYVRQGLPLDQAHRQASRRLGNLSVAKEQARDVDTLRWVTDIWGDARDAYRSLRRHYLFSIATVLTLAVVLGGHAAILSLLHAVTVRTLPVREPEQLVHISTVFRTNPGLQAPLSLPMFRELRRNQQVFSSMLAWWGPLVMTVESDNALTSGAIWGVTGEFFGDLGLVPHDGRFLDAAEIDLEGLTATPSAVLGYRFWQRHFGADPHAIGRLVRIEGVPFTIVGIAPPGFRAFGLTVEVDVMVPFTVYPQLFNTGASAVDYQGAGNVLWMRATGRLKEGVTVDQARAQLAARWPSVQAATIPSTYTGAQRDNFFSLGLAVRSAARGWDPGLTGTFRRPVYVAMGVSLLLLLVACVNLTALMLARSVARHREIAVRAALGASRWRLARPVLLEGVLLSVAAAACGAGPAYWVSVRLAIMLLPADSPVPLSLNMAPDADVVGLAAGLTVVVGILFSMVPAWHLARSNGDLLLRPGIRLTRSDFAGRLVIGSQLALSLILLVTAGLFVRTVQHLESVDAGFEPQGVSMASVHQRPGTAGRPDNAIYYPELVARVATLPGVRRASLATEPIGAPAFARMLSPIGMSPADGIPSAVNGVSPQFFASLGMKLLRGRDVDWSDRSGTQPVVILSRRLASRLFPDSEAIGQHIRIGTGEDLEVVGIVSDARLWDVRDPMSYAAFVPLLQQDNATTSRVLFVQGPDLNARALQQAVESLGPDYVTTTKSVDTVLSTAIQQERTTAKLAAAFGALALGLAAIGMFGVVSYAVTQRTKEVAIRLALGAGATRIVGSIVRDGLRVTLIGCAVGLVAALSVARILRSLLFGVAPYDPTTLMVAPLSLLAATMLACLIPAIRAARVEPIVALRAD